MSRDLQQHMQKDLLNQVASLNESSQQHQAN